MKKGEKVCVKRNKIYGERRYTYQMGVIEEIYSYHILVKFEYENGNEFKESFFEYELIKKEDLSANASIY